MSVADQNGLRLVFRRGARHTSADECCRKSVIRIAREFDTRRDSPTFPCRQSDFGRRAPTSPNADWEAADLQPKRTLRVLKSRLAKCHVRCLRSNESYRRYLRHWEHCHGDEKICRFAHGGSCSRTFLHDDDSYRRRCDYQHGRVARLARHRQSQLHVPCNGSTGRTYEKTIGRAILDATWLFNSKFGALSKVRRDEGAVKRLVTKATA
jgi:hypothetical protein